jgi:hypothetical protein
MLNIDRDREGALDPVNEINSLIEDIYHFVKPLDSDTPGARLVPLKNKIKQLQDIIAQFGADGSFDVNDKQQIIMRLINELQMLSNQLARFHGIYSDIIEICSNYLLNHLCTTAAVDPRATVIGVSNVLAQVLSKEISIQENIEFDLKPTDPKYFEEFALNYNNYLTIAGLFSAPVLGLPEIPMSQLGSWADLALRQFAALNQFVDDNYSISKFYQLEKEANAIPFDTTNDILSFYVYENEFIVALMARADIISGIEFPRQLTEDNQPVILHSIEDINTILAKAIVLNCDKIDQHLNTVHDLYKQGVIDINENPESNLELMSFRTESQLWRAIAKYSEVMKVLFENKQADYVISEIKKAEILSKIEMREDIPLINKYPSNIELELLDLYLEFLELNYKLYPQAKDVVVDNFIKSSNFIKFRFFLQYPVHLVAAHDIFLKLDMIWTPFLQAALGKFFLESASAYNPITSLEVGILSIITGVINDTRVLVDKGLNILNTVKPNLEFQIHHLLVIEVLDELIKKPQIDFIQKIEPVIFRIQDFLTSYEVNPSAVVFQRANLYQAMLKMYEGSNEFLRKEEERFVSLDPFTWIIIPKEMSELLPYTPLNTALDNLNAG